MEQKKVTGARYKSEELAGKKFDTIVIGSGMSGLATACLMAKRGRKVIVLEKHNKAGGFTHSFRRKNFEWDVGLHYIGDVGSDKSSGKKLFDYVTGGKVSWHKMKDPYDSALFPDQTYDFVSGKKNFVEKMLTYFPGERKALEDYLNLLKTSLKTSELFFGAKVLPSFLGSLASLYANPKFNQYSDLTVTQALSKITNNQKLISVLTTQWGDYGLPPHKASFMIHAMVANHYLNGGYFPLGGSKVIASSVLETLRESAGEVYIRAEVDKLLVRKEKCFGVRMKNGDEIYADQVISSAGIFNTFTKFMEDKESSFYKKSLLEPLSSLEPSMAHVAVYLGLDKSSKDLSLREGNQWIFPSYDHKKNVEDFTSGKTKEFPVVYVSFPSAKDPLWDDEHPGTSTIDVISLLPYEWTKKWDGTKWANRGDDYLALKEELANELLKVTIKNNPGIEDHIVVKEVSTPLSTKHFSGYQQGEIYGLSHDPSRFRQKVLRPSTPVKNLYLTGQDILSAGVMGALSSGLLTSIAVMKKNLQKDFM